MMMSKILTTLTLAAALTAGSALAGENCGAHHEAKSNKGSEVDKAMIKSGADKRAEYQARFPEIKRDELQKAITEKTVFLVDANGTDSYVTAHIPGAVNFDKAAKTFTKDLPADKSTLIVAYCGGPGCEAWCKAADKLDEMGYKNIRHYKGGIKEWKQAGLETASVKTKG